MAIIQDGKTSYQIITPGRRYPVENEAARILQQALLAISGVRVPVRWGDRKIPQIPTIWIGEPEADPAGFRAYDSYSIEVKGQDLFLKGAYRRGTHYAVTAFLEFVGVGFYLPDEPDYPCLDHIDLPQQDFHSKSAFSYRHIFYPDAQRPERALQLKLNVHGGDDERWGPNAYPHSWGHSFSALVPTDQYFDTHPEYFSLVDGQRRRERPQLCCTNQEVAEVVCSNMEKWIQANPRRTIFAVGQNDWHNQCECDACRAVDEHEGSQMGQVLTLVNRVAERFPEKTIATLAYQWTVDPPKHMQPRENVLIVLCHNYGCYTHGLDRCELNQPFFNRLKGWREKTKNILIWDYYVDYRHYLLPTANFKRIENDFRLYRDMDIPAMFCQGSACTGGQFEHLRQFVQAKLLWNPDLAVDTLMREWAEGVFGKQAGGLVLEYLNSIEKKQSKENIHMYRYSQALFPDLFTKEFLAYGKRLWDEAEEKAENATFARRVRAFRSAEMASRLIHTPGEYRLEGKELRLYPPPDEDLVERFVDACIDANVSYLREDTGAPEDFRKDFGRSYRAVVLQNNTFRAVILPELGGRIYSFVHLQTGVELLAVPEIHANVTSAPHTDGYDFSLAPPEYQYRVGIGAMEAYSILSEEPTTVTLRGVTTRRSEIISTFRLTETGFSVNHAVTNTGNQTQVIHPVLNPSWSRNVFSDEAVLTLKDKTGREEHLKANPQQRRTRDLFFGNEAIAHGSWVLREEFDTQSQDGQQEIPVEEIVIRGFFDSATISHVRLIVNEGRLQTRHCFRTEELVPTGTAEYSSRWEIDINAR